jgi:hypothetical protein
MLLDLPVGCQAPFFEFVQDSGRTHVQHPRRIAEAARIHRHVDDLLLDLRQETDIGILEEKRSSTPEATLAAPVALLALRRRAMAYNIGAVTVGAVKHLRDHRGSLSYGWFCSAQTPIKNSRSTDLKHLREFVRYNCSLVINIPLAT